MIETAVVIGFDGRPLHWHEPPGRSGGHLPDSRELWNVLWEHRAHLLGVAHSHPGTGEPEPSSEDLSTFAAVEAALGRRLVWWIVNNSLGAVMLVWDGPGPQDYLRATIWAPSWATELRARSHVDSSAPPKCDHGVSFDEIAARGLSAAEVRQRWPRLGGPCPKGCGYVGAYYASWAHFVSGDW